MRLWPLLLASLAACYQAPTAHSGCEITCDSSCPGDLTCENGFCVGPGQVCKPTFTQVAPGTGFACALDDQASVWCWGSNLHHVIDPGAQTAFPLATRIDHSMAWTVLDAGGDQVCGIASGQLYCWGGNTTGEVGRDGGDVSTPTAVSVAGGPSTWSAVSTGMGYTCAIGDGGLWCWGTNSYGELGDGDTNQTSVPTRVGTNSDWVSVAAGRAHTCAINAAGELWCWGYCSLGQCGPNTTSSGQTTPVSAGVTATAAAVNSEATTFVTPAGALEGIGADAYGELGEAMVTTMTSTPVAVSSVMGWTSVAAAERSFCGLARGDVYCWGSAYTGGLGRGYWNDVPGTTSPAIAKVTSGASQLDVGWNNDIDPATMTDQVDLDLACALIGGEVACWGDNRYGQLAQGAATMTATPTEIAGHHLFSDVVLGASHGCGIENGGLLCWGSTEYGAVSGTYYGNGGAKKPCVAGSTPDEKLCDVPAPKAINLVAASDAIAAGLYHTCTLHSGIMTCWGDNSYGELASNSPAAPVARPVAGIGGVAWKTIFATGRYGQCASPTTGGTYCWGQAVTTVTTPGHEAALDGALAIVVAGITEFLCALDANGMLVCIGDNSQGQYGDGTQTSQAALTPLARTYSALSAFGYGDTVCAIAGGDSHVECWGANTRGATGATDVSTPTLQPHAITGLAGCSAIAVGALHACALCGGTVSCWGDNRFGQLGTGATSALVGNTPTTVDLPDLANDSWKSIASSGYFTCARSAAGATYCWGVDGHGGLGNGGTSANLPVTVIAQPAL